MVLDWFRQRHIKVAFSYSLCFLIIGLNIASIGPILLDLLERISSHVDDSGWLFTSRSFGYFLGSILGGVIVDKWPHTGNKFIAIAMVLTALFTAAVPFAYSIWIVCACLFVVGVAMGSLDCAANVQLIHEFKRVPNTKVDPFMQMLHAAFALGAFSSPILVEIVNQKFNYDVSLWIIAATFLPASLVVFSLGAVQKDEFSGDGSSSKSAKQVDSKSSDKIKDFDAFIVDSFDRENELNDDDADGGGGDGNDSATTTKGVVRRKRWLEWTLVILGSLYLLFYVGTEIAAGGFIDAYCQTIVLLSKDESTFINAGYWGLFSVGRLLSIFVSMKISAGRLLVGAMILSISAISIPLIFGVSAATMWSAMTIFGFALAPCFPSMFNCLESHMHLAGVHASLLSIGSALGEMIIPMSMSLVFRRYTLAALIWCLLASISAGVLFLGATLVVARCVDRYQSGHQHIPLSAMGDIDNEIQFSDDDEI